MNALRANHHQRTFAVNCMADNAVSVMGHDRAVKGRSLEAKELRRPDRTKRRIFITLIEMSRSSNLTVLRFAQHEIPQVSRSMYSRTFER